MKNNLKFGIFSRVFFLLVLFGLQGFGQSITVVNDQSN